MMNKIPAAPEEQELQDQAVRLSEQLQEKTKDLPEDVRKIITEYVETIQLAADHDGMYLYEQGVKDCVALLKGRECCKVMKGLFHKQRQKIQGRKRTALYFSSKKDRRHGVFHFFEEKIYGKTDFYQPLHP